MKLLQDNIVFLTTFFGTLIALATVTIKLGTLYIRENSAGKKAITEINETIKKDREALAKVLETLHENNKFIIDRLIEKTKL